MDGCALVIEMTKQKGKKEKIVFGRDTGRPKPLTKKERDERRRRRKEKRKEKTLGL